MMWLCGSTSSHCFLQHSCSVICEEYLFSTFSITMPQVQKQVEFECGVFISHSLFSSMILWSWILYKPRTLKLEESTCASYVWHIVMSKLFNDATFICLSRLWSTKIYGVSQSLSVYLFDLWSKVLVDYWCAFLCTMLLIVKVMLSGSQQFSDSVCVVMLLQMEESIKGSSGETFIIWRWCPLSSGVPFNFHSSICIEVPSVDIGD